MVLLGIDVIVSVILCHGPTKVTLTVYRCHSLCHIVSVLQGIDVIVSVILCHGPTGYRCHSLCHIVSWSYRV